MENLYECQEGRNDDDCPLTNAITSVLLGETCDQDFDEEPDEEEGLFENIPFLQSVQAKPSVAVPLFKPDTALSSENAAKLHQNSQALLDMNESISSTLYLDSDYSTPSHVTPTKFSSSQNVDSHTSQDPLTPTTNLKVLLHAASPEIRNYERRKLCFKQNATSITQVCSDSVRSKTVESAETMLIKDNGHESVSLHSTVGKVELDGTSANLPISESGYDSEERFTAEISSSIPDSVRLSKRKTCNRKEKSLGLLCHRFLRLYPEHPKTSISICLDDAAVKLAVGRRRIYDIINVLESIKVVTRLAKNNYTWRGRIGLSETLCNIRNEAEENGYANRLRMNFNHMCQLKMPITSESTNTSPASVESSIESENAVKRRDKSLGILSKKFVTLFIVHSKQLVSLEMAARILITNGNPTENKYKTKVRRLYDIANILTSLKLIKKVYFPGQKPAFSWTGPEIIQKPRNPESPQSSAIKVVVSSPVANIWSSPNFKLSAADDSGFSSLCQIAEQERKDLCIATPVKGRHFTLRTPAKGSRYTVLTPIKSSADTVETSSIVDENVNLGLDSSFDSDEVFRKELESLRQRFPSPMSRLLSACNVQEALSQHKMKKMETQRAMPTILPLASTPLAKCETNALQDDMSNCNKPDSSPIKVSLSYLLQQQDAISKTVDVTRVDAVNLSHHVGTNSMSSQNIRICKHGEAVNSNQLLRSDGQVLVPVSNIQFVDSEKVVSLGQKFITKSTCNKSCDQPSRRNMTKQPGSSVDAENNIIKVCNAETLKQTPRIKYLVPLVCKHTGGSSGGFSKTKVLMPSAVNVTKQAISTHSVRPKKAFKVVINPSHIPGQFSNISTQIKHSDGLKWELKPSASNPILEQAGNQNSVDFNSKHYSKHIPMMAYKPAKSKQLSLKAHTTAGMSRIKNSGRISSVVTNLVSRLEKQGFAATNDATILHSKHRVLQEINSESGQVPIAIVREKKSQRDLIKPFPKRPRVEKIKVMRSNDIDENVLAVPHNNPFHCEWNERESAFSPAQQSIIASGHKFQYRLQDKAIGKENRPVSVPHQVDGIVKMRKLNKASTMLASRSLGCTPINFEVFPSRPQSSISLPGDIESHQTSSNVSSAASSQEESFRRVNVLKLDTRSLVDFYEPQTNNFVSANNIKEVVDYIDQNCSSPAYYFQSMQVKNNCTPKQRSQAINES